MSAESSLYDSKTVFKSSLKELQEKAAMLSSALDREVEAKNDVTDELSRVRVEFERVMRDQQDVRSKASDQERVLSQQLAETLRNNAVLESDLKNAKYEMFVSVQLTLSRNPLPLYQATFSKTLYRGKLFVQV